MAEKRTKKIRVSQNEEFPDIDENPLKHAANPYPSEHYVLHIEAARAPDGNLVKDSKKTENRISEKEHAVKKDPSSMADTVKPPERSGNISKPLQSVRAIPNPPLKRSTPGRKILNRVWNVLEWIATTALIFMVLFFAMNYSSYSELFKHKIEQVTGGFKINPYMEKLSSENGEEITQELLPLESDLSKAATVVPPLTMTIAPPDDRIIIPRINKNVPVIAVNTENLVRRDWGALEKDIQVSLKDGVVHYPGTAQPGDNGNVVITGHSSYFPWDPGRFKDVFALLHEVAVKDRVIVYHDQIKYEYEVYDKQVVLPDQIEVLTQEGENKLTLITCTPVGTNLKRLIIFAKPV